MLWRSFLLLVCSLSAFSCADQVRVKAGIKLESRDLNSVTALSDFECFGINIVANDIPSGLSALSPATLLPLLLNGSSSCSYPGVFSVQSNPGTSLSAIEFVLSVPKGSSRLFQIFGVDDTSGGVNCSTLTAADLFDEASGDRFQVYQLGTLVRDISVDQYVEQNVSFTSASATRIDCADNVVSRSAPDLTGSYSGCASNSSFFLTYANTQGSVATGSSQRFSLTVSDSTGTLSLEPYFSSDCSGLPIYTLTYSYSNFSAGNYISTDTSNRDLYELNYKLSSVTLNTGSSTQPSWANLCTPDNIPTNTNVDVLALTASGRCGGIFPVVGDDRMDIVSKNSSGALLFGTTGILGTPLFTSRPGSLVEFSYVAP